MWVFVPNAIIASFKPIIISYKKANEEQYKINLQRLYTITSIVCVVFAIGITIFSKLIVYILYGQEFINASTVLYILIWSLWFGIIGNVHYVWLVCENKEKYSLFYSFSGSFSNIICNLIFIRKYGMYGAAIATLISQFIANVLSFAIFKETRELTKNALEAICFIGPIRYIKNNIRERKCL